jgi:hypothetical protein
MAGPSKVGKKELAKLASEQANVLAFADRNREIVELPEGLETGYTKRRKRGDRSDSDCINEICELVSHATASVRFVGVRWATWQAWLKKNRELDDLAIPVSKRKHISLLACELGEFFLSKPPCSVSSTIRVNALSPPRLQDTAQCSECLRSAR